MTISILSHGGIKMKDKLPRYTLRVSRELLDKLGYIAEFEGRTKRPSWQITNYGTKY